MQIIAMGFLIIAQALQAFQTVVEEHLLHNISAIASELCAFEGFWGLYLQVFIAMPLANVVPESAGDGLFEHTIESLQMIFESWKRVGIVMAYSLSLTRRNVTGMIVAAVHRNVYEALRCIAV
jgi:hypothetical protein